MKYEDFLDIQLHYINNHFGVEMSVDIDPVKNKLYLDSYPITVGDLAGGIEIKGGLDALDKFIQDIMKNANQFRIQLTDYDTGGAVNLDQLGSGAVSATLEIRNKIRSVN